jgi:hypothetical protein
MRTSGAPSMSDSVRCLHNTPACGRVDREPMDPKGSLPTPPYCRAPSHAIAENEFPQEVPMALSLILVAVTEQRHPPPSRELLH